MASNVRRPVTDYSNPRSILRNKLTNDMVHKAEAKHSLTGVPDMSPEAKKAMEMAHEDAKENITSSPERTKSNLTLSDSDLKDRLSDKNNNFKTVNGAANVKANANDPKTQKSLAPARATSARGRNPPCARKATASSLRTSTDITARSRSTLSRTDPSYSISDHNESLYTNDNSSKSKGGHNYAPSSLFNNDSSGIDADDNNNDLGENIDIHHGEQTEAEFDDSSDDNDKAGDSRDDETDSQTTQELPHSKSFVLALDRALELNCISRLRGDITDTAGLSEPGKVRALNGGRLANAQEVVVNVCHDDDKELVFHDDDDESLDTARTISQIRINLWMEYNETFQPDNDTVDLYVDSEASDTEDGSDKTTSAAKEQLKVPNAKSSTLTRGRNGVMNSNKSNMASRVANKPGTAVKRQGNTHSGSTSGSHRDASSTRIGSAVSNDSSTKRSANSSKKNITTARRKAT